MENYNKKVENIKKEFSLLEGSKKIVLKKSTSNLFRDRKLKNVKRLNVRDFNEVINIDKDNRTADVEGMITYEKLVNETLKYDLIPCVVPELKTITVGGACSGLGIESSSFKYGLVHETVIEMDILTGKGDVITCNAENENSDLFFGFPNSYGTLGYALRVKLKLIPVKKYVHLKHEFYNMKEDFFSSIERKIIENNCDFLEGVVFDEDMMYITTGVFTDTAPHISDYSFMKIYYKSIKEKKEDYLKIKDYIWRWDTDWFWCSKVFYVQNPVIRFLWGRRNLNSGVYKKISDFHKKIPLLDYLSLSKKESVIQDVQIPVKKSREFLEFFLKEIGIKPVWICPTKIYDKRKIYPLYKMDPEEIYINFGFWGSVKFRNSDRYHNKLIEKKVIELGGRKSLYSTSYFEEQIFWELYNRNEYEKLKKRYDPANLFRNLFEKCVLKM